MPPRQELLGRAIPAALLFAVLLLGSCGPAPETASTDLVVALDEESRIDPAARLGESGRIVFVDLAATKGEERSLASELAAAGNPTVSWNGRRVLFAGRQQPSAPVSLFTASIPEGAVQPLDVGVDECGSADELPDGRIVFSARTSDPSPAPELASGWALFVHQPETGETNRITFGLGEIDPAVLGDGRIVYAGWQPEGDGRPAGGAFALFTVHPDGSGVAPFHGHHGGPRFKLRPRELANGDVVFLAGNDPGELRAFRIDRRAPTEPAIAIESPSGTPLRTVVPWRSDIELGLDVEGKLTELPSGETLPGNDFPAGVADLAPVVERDRPQGHLSMIDPSLDRGRVFGVDARVPSHREESTLLRIRGGASETPCELGRVELAKDGSFFVEVPANLPLWFDVLDASGAPVEVSTTPIWVRPGEKRGCVGCHENPATAPPNRRPRAVLAEPVVLVGETP